MTFVDLDATLFDEHTEQAPEEAFDNGQQHKKVPPPPPPHMMRPSSNLQEEYTPNQSSRPTPPKKKKQRPEKNQDFQDVEITGKWGTISRREIICVALVTFAIIVGVVAAVVLVTMDDNTEQGETIGSPPEQVDIENVFLSPKDQYNALIAKIMESKVADSLLADLPSDVVALEEENADNPIAKAASFVVFQDPISVKMEKELIPRFVMASIFIAHGGGEWKSANGWMSPYNVCDWFGITCNPAKEPLEIDLSSNGLTGDLQDVWALLPHTSSVLLNDNNITGTIPGEAFGAMPLLTYLHLQDNALTGTIPVSLKNSGTLDTLYVQNNQLTGSWPAEFCPECRNCDRPFQEFGLNCDQMDCFCCVPILNCFD